MEIIDDPWFYVVAVPAVFMVGMSKGGIGGLGTIAVPIMSFAIDPLRAAAILLPILCVMDWIALYTFRGRFDKYHLKILLPAAIVGVVCASLLMGQLSTDALRIMIGALATLFCLNYWLAPASRRKEKPGPRSGYFWGWMAGFTSTQIHAGGPPISMYMLPQKLDKVVLMGSMVVFFTIINAVKLIPFTILGQFDARNLWTSLILVPLAPLGIRTGFYLLNRINQAVIYRILYILLFLAGAKLLWDGLS